MKNSGRLSWPFRRSRGSSITTQAQESTTEENELHLHSAADTIEEIGLIMQKQGRFLDEITTRSNALAAENIVLRERISSGIDSVSKSSMRESSAFNIRKGAKGDGALQKTKDENAMLLQQADLLAKELNDAHASIAERDSSISVLSSELSGLMEKARTLMIEKKTWKSEIMDKETEIESLHTREKQSNSLRSELSATVEQMQVDLESTRAEAEMLVSSTTRSVSEMEELRATLLLKQNEVERLDGERQEMERELCSVRRDVKTSNENAKRLGDLNCHYAVESDELQQKIKELSEELFNSDLKEHTLQSKADFLEKEMNIMTKSRREDIASITNNFSKIKEQHAVEVQAKENMIDKLRRSISQLEIENSSNQREKQSLEQRCLSLKSSLDTIAKDHQRSFQEVVYRAEDAENQLQCKQKEVEGLKKIVVKLEGRLQTIQAEADEKESMLTKSVSSLQDELKAKKHQIDALTTAVDRLQDESKQSKRIYAKAGDDLQQETENRIRSAEVEVEKLRAQMTGYQLNAKRAEGLQEKNQLMYEALLDGLKSEMKEQRNQMEMMIRRERDVNTCLLTKANELNNTISKLSADNCHLKEVHNEHVSKIQDLEQAVSLGNAKLRTMASNYCKLSDEQELLISKESEMKRRLIELEKIKVAMQQY